jgi:GTP-binding protein
VNKVDNDKRAQDVWNYTTFGFDVVGISAAHGGNMNELEEYILKKLEGFSEEADEVSQEEIKLAIVGKPNTGKSTLTNLLTGSSLSIVSEIPGTTRDVVEGRFIYKDNIFNVLDTAGIRRKSKVTENVEYYSVNRAIKTIERADLVFLLIDAQDGLADQDKKIASLAVTRGKGIILVLNKWDKLEHIPNRFQAVEDRIRFLFPIVSFAPIISISALENTGIEDLLSTGLKVWRQLNKSSPTAAINKALGKWQDQYAPPSGKQRLRYKVRYCTQSGSNPVRFALFVNKKKGFPQGYVQFLKNQIRKEFGYSHIPIIIDTREG